MRGADPIAEFMEPIDDDALAALDAALEGEPLQRRLDIRRAWIEAIAARHRLVYVEKLLDSTAAAAELAGRMERVGNTGRRSSAREQLRHAEAAVVVASARHAALVNRERLAQLLPQDRAPLDDFALPARLPNIPSAPHRPEEIADAPAGVADDGNPMLREAWLSYRSKHRIAQLYRERILPLRKTLSEERLYEYNGMLIGVFDLLVDSREAIQAVLRAIDASRRFWLADVDLRSALAGLPPRGPVTSADVGVAELLDEHVNAHDSAH